MNINNLQAKWKGCDGWGCDLTGVQVLRLYLLMEGGVEDVGKLSELAGVRAHKLTRSLLARIHRSADDSWHLIRRYSPTIPLWPGQSVRCRKCRAKLHDLPCRYCHCPPDWIID